MATAPAEPAITVIIASGGGGHGVGRWRATGAETACCPLATGAWQGTRSGSCLHPAILVGQRRALADRLAVVVCRAGPRQGLDIVPAFDPDDAELLAGTAQVENRQVGCFATADHERCGAEQRVELLVRWIVQPGVSRFGDCGSPRRETEWR